MAKALLINPSYRDSYGSAKAAITDPVFPTLSLLTTAAMAEQHGHRVEVLDLSYMQYDFRIVRDAILKSIPPMRTRLSSSRSNWAAAMWSNGMTGIAR